MGRGSAWSDERVREATRDFVPAADEVWRLQRGNDAESLFFQRSVNGGKPITDEGSRQGTWVLAPGGKLLAHANSSNPEHVLKVLAKGLERWSQLSGDERHLSPEAALTPGHRWEDSSPEGGLVLARYARDLPTGKTSKGRRRWNKDFAWFTQSEARQWLADDPQPGARHVLPKPLAMRLARFHLVDNVRGQTLPYAPEEIAKVELSTVVQKTDGKLVTLTISGSTSASANGPWLLPDSMWTPTQTHPHSIETQLLGQATFDLATQTFTDFDLVAVGWRTGRTAWNGRSRDSSPGPIGFRFVLAPPEPRVAPAFVAVYGVDWIELPDDPRQLRQQ